MRKIVMIPLVLLISLSGVTAQSNKNNKLTNEFLNFFVGTGMAMESLPVERKYPLILPLKFHWTALG